MKRIILLMLFLLSGCMRDECIHESNWPYIAGDMATVEIEGVI